MGYRGVLFDFGGVLTTPMRGIGAAFERAEGLVAGAYGAALTQHPEGVRIYAELELGRATQEEWNRVVGGILGIDPTDLMRRALAHLRPERRIVEFAAAARAAGLRVGVLSNSFGLDPFDVYREFGVYESFDAVLLSEVEGVRKPDPEIYRRALAALGVRGEECVFVDDHAGNLPPAQALGMATVHATDVGATVRRLAALLGVVP
ncbi:HAD family hydrolase [Streptomyces sp. 4N509B]|uniref:HAD family hydrolase n=1 Tax=Streptomyces sp. 4N509B TaxID=3457413 RepID=UPI003FD21BAB